MNKEIITVTGGTGYIASWIVKNLLENGTKVRITVRDKNNLSKYQHLLDISNNCNGVLEVFEADLLIENSFDNAVNGASIVIHTASPFFLDDKGDTRAKLITPAVNGTINLLNSVNKFSSVQKVILTSSIAAIYGDNKDLKTLNTNKINENMWNNTSSDKHNAYSYSKTLAEQKAWEMHNKQSRWGLITINPGFVLGPSLTKRIDSTSIHTVLRILRGEIKTGAPDLDFVFSDVRDIAKGHILAAFSIIKSGRYIIANESGTLLDLSKIIDNEFPKLYKVPNKKVPKFLLWLVAPTIGFTRKFVSLNIGYPLKADNSKSIKELKINYIPLKQTILDHVSQLEKDKLVLC